MTVGELMQTLSTYPKDTIVEMTMYHDDWLYFDIGIIEEEERGGKPVVILEGKL